MDDPLCSHVSIHLLRFATERTVADLGTLPSPPGTAIWLSMVDVRLGDNVLAARRGTVWGVVGLHDRGNAADATVASADSWFPPAAETTESWHAAFDVVGHHGAVDWLDAAAPGLALDPVEHTRAGPLAVMTTAGFTIDENFDFARAQNFAFNTDRVRDVLAGSPGNVLTHVLNAAEPAGPDGITFTIWRDDAAMRNAVYQPGDHRDQLDRYKREQTADRTSFTRLRPRTTSGTWNGVDPIDVAAG